ncbi:MAG TPA: peptidoglycan DD-metalloendopeptidase family protein [Candidatus Bathyarchaeia archaeon]|nr:peptidoglycan DD-metalloendopeptidase family protein [Candidatus Bathyarchaeia archaeon]
MLAPPLLAVAFVASFLATPAMADGPTSTPFASPSPTPTPTPTHSSSASPSTSPSASPSARPSGSPSPSPSDTTAAASASPAATPSASPDPDAARADAEAARARDAALLANARSLAQIIEAQARVAQDELAGLDPQIAQVASDLDAVNADIAALQAKSEARRSLRDRLEREALRLAALPSAAVPANLSDAQREALDDLRSLQSGLLDAQTKLAERADLLSTLKGSVGAKQAYIARLRDRARSLAAAAASGDSDAKAAQIAVLTALAQDATNAQTALAQLVASAMVRNGTAGAWSLPVRGVLTQPFGPTSFELEPSATYKGVSYAHFHAAIDLAAPLGTPVTAASDGVVAFVGHLPDGAMIVLVAHAGGYVSEYAHLDDTFALPPVRAGQAVKAGQVIGFIGLTGITTGAHLHFAVMKDGAPIDPLGLLQGS